MVNDLHKTQFNFGIQAKWAISLLLSLCHLVLGWKFYSCSETGGCQPDAAVFPLINASFTLSSNVSPFSASCSVPRSYKIGAAQPVC